MNITIGTVVRLKTDNGLAIGLVISSGVYRFFGMTMTSLVAVQPIIHPGPNLPGQVNELGCLVTEVD